MARDDDVVVRVVHARDLTVQGLEALREAVLAVLSPCPVEVLLAEAGAPVGRAAPAQPLRPVRQRGPSGGGIGPEQDDRDLAASSEDCEEERTRLIALVELARGGDKEAFGLLFDHYHPVVYRFLHHRTRSVAVAEDLTSETFLRALRAMNGFRWQGRDFGAWLITIARNLATDHFRAGRTRLESTTDDMGLHDEPTPGPEQQVLARLTHEAVLDALHGLPDEQRDCLVMRFLQGMSIAETAQVLGRSDGAVKQLQLRGVRNLAKRLPKGVAGS